MLLLSFAAFAAVYYAVLFYDMLRPVTLPLMPLFAVIDAAIISMLLIVFTPYAADAAAAAMRRYALRCFLSLLSF